MSHVVLHFSPLLWLPPLSLAAPARSQQSAQVALSLRGDLRIVPGASSVFPVLQDRGMWQSEPQALLAGLCPLAWELLRGVFVCQHPEPELGSSLLNEGPPPSLYMCLAAFLP